jgi:hypothetical protein
MNQTLGQRVAAALRTTAQSYAAGDQVAPCAVLWTDPDRLWEGVLPALQAMLPELFVLGAYAPAKRTGPALWLRCIEARVVDGAPPAGTAPILYLPGISREKLRAAEECPQELAALVELQYRGVMWLHVNGKEWTPFGFLVSKHGGLDLDVAKDQATLDALAGALPSLMAQPIAQLQGRRLDAEFFNALLAPDATGLLLRWLSDPEPFKKCRSAAEWKAFCHQCKSDAGFDPVRDGPLKGGGLARFAGELLEQGLAALCRGAGELSRHSGMAAARRTEKPRHVRLRRGLAEHQRVRRAGPAAGAGVAGGSAAGRGDSPGGCA